MAKARTLTPARQRKILDALTPTAVIVGRHPTMHNLYRLSQYATGDIKIERQPYVSHNPSTGKEELTHYDDLIDLSKNQIGLWTAIAANPSDEWPS